MLVFGVIGGAKSDAAARQCHDRDTGMAAAITVCIVVELGSWGFFTPSWWQVAKGWGSAVVLVSGYLYLSLCRCIHSIPYRYTIKRACWREGAVAGCFVLCLVLTGFGRSWRDDCSCFCCVCAVCLCCLFVFGINRRCCCCFCWILGSIGVGMYRYWKYLGTTQCHSHTLLPSPASFIPTHTHTHIHTESFPPSSTVLSSPLLYPTYPPLPLPLQSPTPTPLHRSHPRHLNRPAPPPCAPLCSGASGSCRIA